MKVTIEDVASYIAWINTEYNIQMDEEKLGMRLDLWHMALKEYDKVIVDKAVGNVIRSSEYPPRVANICNEIKRLENSVKKTNEELWHELTAILPLVERCRYQMNYNTEEEVYRLQCEIERLYNELDNDIKLYVRSQRQLIDLAMSEDLSFEKGRFLREMPNLRESNETRQGMTEEMKNLLIGTDKEIKMIKE